MEDPPVEVSESDVRAFVSRLKFMQSTCKVAGWTFVVGLCWWAYTHPHASFPKLGLAGLLIVCLAMMLVMRSVVRCPRCGVSVFSIGVWCPVCGQRALEPGGFFSAPHCRACDRRLTKRGRHGTIRTYPVCACSHCGLRLGPDAL
jgi:hypothetical protein